MNKKRWLAGCLLLVSAMAPAGALAKGIVEITVSGPGLAGEVKVTEPSTIEALAQVGGAGVPANLLPALGEEFYAVRMAFGGETEEILATNVYHYYPDPAGGAGYVLFFDVEGGYSDAEGWWHRAPSAWDGALRGFLAGQGVEWNIASDPGSGPQSDPATAAADPIRPVILGLALAAAAAAGVLGVRRLRLRAAGRGG